MAIEDGVSKKRRFADNFDDMAASPPESKAPQSASGLPHVSTTASDGSSSWQNGDECDNTNESAAKHTHLPKSDLSLPAYRKQRPTLYWPDRDRREAMIDPKRIVKNPIPDLESRLRYRVVGQSTRSMVMAGRLYKYDVPEENGGYRDLIDDWVAVKVVPCDDEGAYPRAEAERSLLQDLEHNHIIALAGAFEDCETYNNRVGLLLYPLAPQNLNTFLKNLSESNAANRSHPNQKLLLGFYPCLCRAVLYLHAKTIKHRDIKPGNILVDGENTVILTDLDISKRYNSMAEARTYGKVPCTVKYAPRSAATGGRHGWSWDVNSLGFVFLEMASMMFGETSDKLIGCLLESDRCSHCGDWGHELERCPMAEKIPKQWQRRSQSVADLTDDASETIELKYYDALDKGRIDVWIDHLRTISQRNPDQLPSKQFEVDGELNRFLDMILELMRATERNQLKVLKKARDLFSEFAVEDCEHCHPSKTNYGNIEPNDMLEPPIETSDASSLSGSGCTSDDASAHVLEDGPQAPGSQECSGMSSYVDVLQSDAFRDSTAMVHYPCKATRSQKLMEQQESPPDRPQEEAARSIAKAIPFSIVDDSTLPEINIHGPSRATTMTFPDDPAIDQSQGTDSHGSSRDASYESDRPNSPRDPTSGAENTTPRFEPATSQARNVMLDYPAPPPKWNRKLRVWTFSGRPYSIGFNEVPGKKIAVCDPRTSMFVVYPKEYMNDHNGILIKLPRGSGKNIRMPGDQYMDFRKAFGIWRNGMRWAGMLRFVFVHGEFQDEKLVEHLSAPRST